LHFVLLPSVYLYKTIMAHLAM